MHRKQINVIILVFTFLLSTTFSYAEQETFGDGQIDVDFPVGWDIAVKGDIPEKVRDLTKWDESEFEEYFDNDGQIFIAYKSIKGDTTALELNYVENVTSDESFREYDSKSAIESFHEEYGKDAIEESLYTVKVKPGNDYDIVSSNMGYFVRVPVEFHDASEPYESVVYYMPVNKQIIAFTLSPDSGVVLDEQVDVADEIVASFNDSGYYEEFSYMRYIIYGAIVLAAVGIFYGVRHLITRKKRRSGGGTDGTPFNTDDRAYTFASRAYTAFIAAACNAGLLSCELFGTIVSNNLNQVLDRSAIEDLLTEEENTDFEYKGYKANIDTLFGINLLSKTESDDLLAGFEKERRAAIEGSESTLAGKWKTDSLPQAVFQVYLIALRDTGLLTSDQFGKAAAPDPAMLNLDSGSISDQEAYDIYNMTVSNIWSAGLITIEKCRELVSAYQEMKLGAQQN